MNTLNRNQYGSRHVAQQIHPEHQESAPHVFLCQKLVFFLLNSAKDRISTFPNGAKKIKKHKTVFVQHHRPNHRYLGLENPDPVMACEVPAVPAALK